MAMKARVLAALFAGSLLITPALAMDSKSSRGEIAELKDLVKSVVERLDRLEKDGRGERREKASQVPAEVSPRLKGIVKELVKDNERFVKEHKPEYFKPFVDTQKPRATVVTCADSRVHAHAFDQNPDGDLFMVRNIGNQLSTAEGSVEYGVHHLETPLLIFVGHTVCGAIKAASGDYSSLSAPIKRELDTIKISKGIEIMEGVKTNVNNQVAAALKKFDHEVDEGKLTVMGAVYDFRNDLGQGQGKLVITNINGETSADKIAQSPLLDGLKMDTTAKVDVAGKDKRERHGK